MDATTTIIFRSRKMRHLFEGGYNSRFVYTCYSIILYSVKNIASQVDKAFCFDNIVRGHHIYKTVWTLFLRGILTATPEPKYRYDRINNSSTSDSTTLRPDPSSRFFARSFFHSQTLLINSIHQGCCFINMASGLLFFSTVEAASSSPCYALS